MFSKRSAIITAGISYGVFIFLTAPLLFFGKDMEQAYFPVVSNTKLLKVESVGPDAVKIWVAFKKERHCTFIDLAWYRVDPVTRGAQKVRHEFLEDDGSAPTSRPEGFQIAGPWQVNVSPYVFGGEMVAYVRHRCHPLWDTLSKFFP